MNFEITEEKYLTSMINDLDGRAADIGCKIQWTTYSCFVRETIMNDAFHIDMDLAQEYRDYVDECSEYVDFLKQNKNDIDRGVLNFAGN